MPSAVSNSECSASSPAKGAIAAARNGGPGAQSIAIARFFAETQATAAAGLKETIMTGADATLAPEALSA